MKILDSEGLLKCHIFKGFDCEDFLVNNILLNLITTKQIHLTSKTKDQHVRFTFTVTQVKLRSATILFVCIYYLYEIAGMYNM